MDIPRIFNITESAHRIHNPFTPEKLATLGAALRRATSFSRLGPIAKMNPGAVTALGTMRPPGFFLRFNPA